MLSGGCYTSDDLFYQDWQTDPAYYLPWAKIRNSRTTSLVPEMADYLIGALESAGRASVKLSRAREVLIAPPEGGELRATVNALRLDAVLAQTLHLSRARAQTLIRGGAVQKNWQITDRTDAEIAQGDVLSIRGSGRIRVHSVQGESRKGRLFLEVETFLRP